MPCSALHTGYKENYIEEMANTESLGLQIDNHLNLKNRSELMIHKLSGACYAVRSTVHVSDITTLKSTYFADFHSIIKYGIIFGVTLPALQRYQNFGWCSTKHFMQKFV